MGQTEPEWQIVLDSHYSKVEKASGVFPQHRLDEWFRDLYSSDIWQRPVSSNTGLLIPRHAAWLTRGVNVKYKYGGTMWEPVYFDEYFEELSREVFSALRLPYQYNSCNLNLYCDGTQGVGWHSDGEPIFGDRHNEEIDIVSLSLGATRLFQLKLETESVSSYDIPLFSGDVLRMHGMTQAFYQHRIKMDATEEPRINLTWRVIKRGWNGRGI